MGRFFDFLWSIKTGNEDNGGFIEGRDFEDIVESLLKHGQQALKLRKVQEETHSYVGGVPQLPPGVDWPHRKGRPLSFLCSLDLVEVGASDTIQWLPREGRLMFFFDVEEQPWGFNPDDRDGFAVIFAREPGAETEAPVGVFPKFCVDYVKKVSLPDPQRFEDLGISMNEVDIETYLNGYGDWIAETFNHQLGGYPQPIQNDSMELESQLASNGIDCGSGAGYQSDEGQRLAPGAKDWRLLLEFDTDDDLEVMWGDAGKLYFWVKEQDASNGDFTGAWAVLQCH